MSLACGIDLGGTKVALALVDVDGRIVAEDRLTTATIGPAGLAEAAANRVAAHGQPIVGVGIGVAGFVGADRWTVSFTANIDWPVIELPAAVQERLGVPVVVENDAAAAAWGEYRFGAGAGSGNLLMATVGTGVGGGVVLDGALLRGSTGLSAELGHVLVVRDGVACECGAHGCLEKYASGSALVRFARERGHDYADGPAITAAATEGDPIAIDLLAEVGGWLGHGLASAVALLDPDRIVVGGGVAAAEDLLLGPARASLAAGLTTAAHRTPPAVVLAALGNTAGVIGAADLARVP